MSREYNDFLEFDIDKMKVRVWDDEGEEVWIPGKAAVCPTCEGKGTHVNPAIDGNGITQSEMDELGDEFFESYRRGDYDVSCNECNGRRVVVDADVDRLTEQQKAWYVRACQDLYESNAIDRAEARAFGY